MGQLGNNIPTPQELNENEINETLIEEVGMSFGTLLVVARKTRPKRIEKEVWKAAWKEVSIVMSGIDGKDLPEIAPWSCSCKKVFRKFAVSLQENEHAEV